MRTIFALCSILAFSGCAIIIAPDGHDARFESAWGGSAVKGNGDIKTERRPVSGSSALSISGPLQVEVRVGVAAGLEIVGDSNLLSFVHSETSSNGEGQRIWIDEKFRSENPIRVIYTVPNLQNINASGSGRLMVNGLNGTLINLKNTGSRSIVLEGQVAQLEINSVGSGRINATALASKDANVHVQGSGSLNLGMVSGNELKVSIHGSGSVNASGTVRNLVAQIHGSGSADLGSVRSQSAELNSYGSGDITAAVSHSVNAQATGSGHVTVYGNPAQRNVNGKRISFVN